MLDIQLHLLMQNVEDIDEQIVRPILLATLPGTDDPMFVGFTFTEVSRRLGALSSQVCTTAKMPRLALLLLLLLLLLRLKNYCFLVNEATTYHSCRYKIHNFFNKIPAISSTARAAAIAITTFTGAALLHHCLPLALIAAAATAAAAPATGSYL